MGDQSIDLRSTQERGRGPKRYTGGPSPVSGSLSCYCSCTHPPAPYSVAADVGSRSGTLPAPRWLISGSLDSVIETRGVRRTASSSTATCLPARPKARYIDLWDFVDVHVYVYRSRALALRIVRK